MTSARARHVVFLGLVAVIGGLQSSSRADCVTEPVCTRLPSGETVCTCEPYAIPVTWCRACPNPFVKVLFDPSDPTIIYAGITPFGVYQSLDAGVTWAPMNEGLRDLHVSAFEITQGADGTTTLYAGTASGILFTSLDQAQSWQVVGPTGGFRSRMTAIAFNPQPDPPGPDDPVLFVGTAATGISACRADGTCFAMNGGLTNLQVSAIVATPEPGAPLPTLYAGTNGGGVFRFDPATGWLPMSRGLTSSHVSALQLIADAGDGSVRQLFASTFDRGVFTSRDGGSLWQTANAGLTDLQITAMSLGHQGRYSRGCMPGAGRG